MKKKLEWIPSIVSNSEIFYKRIFSLIDEALEYYLVSVEAGIGYGKTKLFREYFEVSQKRNIWLKMNRLDNVPEQFWLRFLGSAWKWDTNIFRKLKALKFPETLAELQKIVKIIQEERLDQHSFVVLDDFQLIDEPKILWLIENIALSEIDGLTIVLLTRKKPKLDFQILHKKHCVRRMTEQELGCQKEEIADLITQYSISPVDKMTDKLFEYTKGWGLAVDLMLHALRRGKQLEDFEEDIFPVIFEVIEKDFFDYYPFHVQYALIKLSLIDVFPLQLVMTLTELRYEEISLVIENNPFINYNYHEDCLEIHYLFLEFLRKRQGYLDANLVAAIKNKSADWYIKNGYGEAALYCYLKSNEYQQIIKITGQNICCGISQEAMVDILGVLENIPSEVKGLFPEIYFQKAFLYFRLMELDAAKKELKKLKVALLKKEEDKEILGEAYILEGMIHLFHKDYDFNVYFQRAFRLIPEGSKMLYKISPFVDGGAGFFAKSMAQEEIDKMFKSYKQGLSCMMRLTHGCGAGLHDFVMGELAYYEGHYSDGERYAYQALYQAREQEQLDMMLGAVFLLLKLAIVRGNIEDGLYIWKNYLQQDLKGEKKEIERRMLDLIQCWFYISVKEEDKVEEWIILNKGGKDLFDIYGGGISKCQWLYHKGRYNETLAYLNTIERKARNRNQVFTTIYIHLIKSQCYFSLGEQENGLKAFEAAYELAGNGKYISFFIEFGSSMKRFTDLIKTMKATMIPYQWLDNIGMKSATYGKRLRYIKREYQRMNKEAPAIQLSERERKILEELCQGMSRQEIAKANYVSENTVKSQLKVIYNKLDAINIGDAVHIYTLLKLGQKDEKSP